MKLLALVLLLSAFSSLTLTEVVNSFKRSCPTFFIRNPNKQNDRIIPTVFTEPKNKTMYKTICQRWRNKYRFATVYDTKRMIPVYSAYTFLRKEETNRTKIWKIEPQLEDMGSSKEMIDSPKEAGDIMHQAVNSDYTDSGYTRGHVFPNNYAANQEQAESTFTLTNIAPQKNDSNGLWAEKVEETMLKAITDTCKLDQNHLAYIVTGVVPGNKWIPISRPKKNFTEGIYIPSHFWSAFCCTSKNDVKKLVARAYIAEQEPFNLRQPSIDNLNKRLTELYKKDFNVFPGLDL